MESEESIRLTSLETRFKALSNIVIVWFISDKLSIYLIEILSHVL